VTSVVQADRLTPVSACCPAVVRLLSAYVTSTRNAGFVLLLVPAQPSGPLSQLRAKNQSSRQDSPGGLTALLDHGESQKLLFCGWAATSELHLLDLIVIGQQVTVDLEDHAGVAVPSHRATFSAPKPWLRSMLA